MVSHSGWHTDPIQDYIRILIEAKKWARYALQNKKEGLPWAECAKLAHEHLSYAIKIIR